MTTIEDWVETFNLVKSQSGAVLSITREKMAMRAVIEKHVGPLMLKAAGRAMACARPEDYQGDMPEAQAVEAMKREHEVAVSIVQTIIAQLKGTQ